MLATISDKKLGHDSSGVVNYYIAEVLSQNDYYPFGMGMPGRQYSAGNQYRYGFNGKENDSEVKGIGNQQDYGMRVYDSRLGRFLALDPLQKEYPELTPYQFASNTPIQGVDVDGREIFHYTMVADRQGLAQLNLVDVKYSNQHSWLWGLITFNTKIDVKRYIIDFEGKKYHIGFPQYGSGYSNAWKAESFETNFVNKPGDALQFKFEYVDDNHSQAASDVALIVNSQNIGLETSIPFEQVSTSVKSTNRTSTEINDGNTEGVKANTFAFKNLQVGEYKTMAKVNAGTGNIADHIPSFAALKKMNEITLGRQLTSSEANALRNSALTIVYESKIHQTISRTFGGRNTTGRILEDAANLAAAIMKDIQALTPSLLKAGYSQQDINFAQQQLIQKYSSSK